LASRNILFVHQNFPGQFPHIAEALRARGDKIAAIGSGTAKGVPGIDVRKWTNSRSSTPGIVPSATKAEADLIRAEAAAYAAMALKGSGFTPDLIIGHPGWGETLFLKEIFPNARLILLGELYYRTKGADTNFDPEFDRDTFATTMNTVAKNATGSLAYADADRIIVPTAFQASTFPTSFDPVIRVLHEGVDLDRAKRKPGARVKLPDGRTFDGSRPVVTFINRSFERVRGFHIFMRALPRLLAEVPDAEIILIGQEKNNTYSGDAPDGRLWKDYMLAEVGERLPLDRVHFLGRVAHSEMINALSISWAHVYYTYPFVLSWSLIEAMGCECLIIGSDTAPVRDAITDGTTGILNDFFDVDALSATMIRACREPNEFNDVRKAAREAALVQFDLKTVGLPGWLTEIDAALSFKV